MGTYKTTTSNRTNFKGGKKNTGSHLIGWDSGKVRSERYTFKTGQWPASKISFHYDTSVYDGKNIAIRCAISTSSTANVNKSGKSGGYAVTKNGTTTISISLKANTTYYIVFYPGVSKSSYGLLRADSNFQITQTVIDRTACKPPTELYLSKLIQTPGESVELSWTGAEAGTNVQIASYEIFQASTPDAAATEWASLGITENTTFTVQAPDTGGDFYYFKVKTKSNPVNYDSELSVASPGLEANRKPAAPTIVKVSANPVPSTGGLVTFEIEAGAVSSGVPTLYYSIGEGDKQPFTSPLTARVEVETSFYFYTFDNTDFSNSTSQTIQINDKPVISSVSGSASTYSALGGTGISGSQLGYAKAITPTITVSESGTVAVTLEYYSDDETDAWVDSKAQSIPIFTAELVGGSAQVLGECNAHKAVATAKALETKNVHWRLKFIFNDGIEDSDPKYLPNANGEYYAVAHAPSLTARYNQFGTSNIEGTIPGEVCDKIRLVIYDDTSTSIFNVTTFIGDSNVSPIEVTTSKPTIESPYRYIDVLLDDTKLVGGATISVTATLEDGDLVKTITGIENVVETKIPTLSKLTYGAPIIKPFTSTGSFDVSTVWPFGTYADLEHALPAYNCDTDVENVIKLVYCDENGDYRVEKTLDWAQGTDSDIIASIDREDVYEWNHSLGYTIYVGEHKYLCRLEITNLFGKTYVTPWTDNTKFDFNEPAQNPTITKIEYSADKVTWDTLQSNQSIQKGMYLRFTCEFGLYTTDAVTLSILVQSGSLAARDPHFYDEDEEGQTEKRLTPITYSNQELAPRADGPTAKIKTKYYIYEVVDDITTNDVRHWSLKITNSGKQAISSTKDTSVLRQCQPTISFTKCKVNKDYTISYRFEVVDAGGGELTYYLSDQSEANIELDDPTGTPPVGEGTTEDEFPHTPAWESKNIYIKVVSLVTGPIGSHTETYYSLPILAYQVTPTVAYRPNLIGINVENPAQGAMVDIHQSTDAKTVLIQGLDNSATPNPTKFDINPTTGEIKFFVWDPTDPGDDKYKLKSTLNLMNGTITPAQ